MVVKQQNHDGQKLRVSRWFFGRLHSYATVIARGATSREWAKKSHRLGNPQPLRTTSEREVETDVEINGRMYNWMIEWRG